MELDEESKDLWRAVVAAAQRAVAERPGNVAEIAARVMGFGCGPLEKGIQDGGKLRVSHRGRADKA